MPKHQSSVEVTPNLNQKSLLASLMADNRYTRGTRRKQLTVLASKPEAQMQIPEEQREQQLLVCQAGWDEVGGAPWFEVAKVLKLQPWCSRNVCNRDFDWYLGTAMKPIHLTGLLGATALKKKH
ncbi:GM14838 [Drosophila sechellia]|uniref:GM14838 n=1 Tax=Drosophila sechellia TaxID=7238 RepID=B4HXG9_DROSE|nr:GM14838 [Drosophila sechellia]